MALPRNNVHLLKTQGLKTHAISTSFMNFENFELEDGRKTDLNPQSSDKIHKRIPLHDCFLICSHCHLLKNNIAHPKHGHLGEVSQRPLPLPSC